MDKQTKKTYSRILEQNYTSTYSYQDTLDERLLWVWSVVVFWEVACVWESYRSLTKAVC